MKESGLHTKNKNDGVQSSKAGHRLEPEKGWHPVFCFMCGKKFSHVSHFGGGKRLKKCAYCQSGFHACLDCFAQPADI